MYLNLRTLPVSSWFDGYLPCPVWLPTLRILSPYLGNELLTVPQPRDFKSGTNLEVCLWSLCLWRVCTGPSSSMKTVVSFSRVSSRFCESCVGLPTCWCTVTLNCLWKYPWSINRTVSFFNHLSSIVGRVFLSNLPVLPERPERHLKCWTLIISDSQYIYRTKFKPKNLPRGWDWIQQNTTKKKSINKLFLLQEFSWRNPTSSITVTWCISHLNHVIKRGLFSRSIRIYPRGYHIPFWNGEDGVRSTYLGRVLLDSGGRDFVHQGVKIQIPPILGNEMPSQPWPIFSLLYETSYRNLVSRGAFGTLSLLNHNHFYPRNEPQVPFWRITFVMVVSTCRWCYDKKCSWGGNVMFTLMNWVLVFIQNFIICFSTSLLSWQFWVTYVLMWVSVPIGSRHLHEVCAFVVRKCLPEPKKKLNRNKV